MAENWHAISTDKVLAALESSVDGLSKKAARARLAEHGPNRLITSKKTPGYVFFFRQFLSPLIYVLLVAAGVSALSGHYLDAVVILGVLFLNAGIGFVQESQAQKAMEALMSMAAPRAQVKRGGELQSIQAESVVPGDIIYLESGNRVPADARIIEEASLKVNESSLTGESVAADKDTEAVADDAPLAERTNMVHMGTIVTYGHGWAVVVSTGMHSQMGQIASALDQEKSETTPIQRSIHSLSKYIVVVVLAILALLIMFGLMRGLPPLEIVLLAAAASVAAIPEGLPAAMTVILAIGMRLMARENAIIRRLVAVETLGSATVICSDKTGTLTANEMTVRKIYVNGRTIDVSGEGYELEGGFQLDGSPVSLAEVDGLELLLRTGVLCNEASLNEKDGDASVMGDPTEISLLVAGAKAGLSKEGLSTDYERVGEIPFESEQQYMAVAYQHSGGIRVYVKGSVEKLLSMSADYLHDGESRSLTDEAREDILNATDSIAGNAMRVLALGYADLASMGNKLKFDNISGNLVLLGLAGMADPPREEVKEAIRRCKDAGIRVLMATGDHKAT
ncbi:MAG: cation-translocating P-type ATPase, partial [Chloroflexota bacterium]